jgi:ParB-like chromosome segregation protein Spo0J
MTADVQFVPAGKVRPAADNPRVHPPEQLAALQASMREFGFPQPILTDGKGEILAGHGRLAAALAIYAAGGEIPGVPAGQVPVVRVAGLTDAERRAYRVADNRLASMSAFDPTLLAAELSDLHGEGVDPALLGFTATDLLRIDEDASRARLAAMSGDEPPDEPPEFNETASGDVVRAVKIEVVIPAIDRQVVYDALVKARAQFNVGTTGDALAALLAYTEALA